MVLELAWIKQLSQGETLSPPPLEETRVSFEILEFWRSACIEIYSSLERIYWALDRSFWGGESSRKPNPSLALNQKTIENQDQKSAETEISQASFEEWRFGISKNQVDQPNLLS